MLNLSIDCSFFINYMTELKFNIYLYKSIAIKKSFIWKLENKIKYHRNYLKKELWQNILSRTLLADLAICSFISINFLLILIDKGLLLFGIINRNIFLLECSLKIFATFLCILSCLWNYAFFRFTLTVSKFLFWVFFRL